MTSFQISLTPSKRAAGRFVLQVRRAIQKALAEEQQNSGITQSEIARKLGVHRSVITRQINGREDMSISRVAELAWALGRKPIFDLPKIGGPIGSNIPSPVQIQAPTANTSNSIVGTGSTGPAIGHIIKSAPGLATQTVVRS